MDKNEGDTDPVEDKGESQKDMYAEEDTENCSMLKIEKELMKKIHYLGDYSKYEQ